MFDKILIANRGEIACRIIRTCRRLGIATVAVYSEADRDALHAEMADEAVFIGAAPAAESYLKGDRIIEAARETGAEAIHPGFGFLAENPDFVRAVEDAGIVFIGPSPQAIAAMGDKIESKRLAEKAGVSTVPGHIGEIADAKEAVRIAREIGYPVMIKASAGGGGKGMRIARSDEECREGFDAARSEARSSFGDERVFIEKYIEEPRHIEVQVLGDRLGRIVHLGERECSIQRRHQKVIEEAPSPFVTPEMRAAMGEQAVALARAVGYHSAGTVEFIVDKDRHFYFLEMNTRLQVEHPVTEMITGLDLVEWMIRIAAGEPLGFDQERLRIDGWAMEARIYAEDPFRNFLPSIGRLVRYREPAAGEELGVRVDSGVREGAEITMFYDPMIAKLVTWGQNRDEAIARMIHALDAYYIRGISHNTPFLSAVMENPRFAEGRLSTNFIAEEYPDGFTGAPLTEEGVRVLMLVSAFIDAVERSRETRMPGQVVPPKPIAGRRFVVLLGDDRRAETVIMPSEEGARVMLGDDRHEIRSGWTPMDPVFSGEIDGRPVTVEIDRMTTGWRLSTRGVQRDVLVLEPRVADLMTFMPEKTEVDSGRQLLCPMPGVVVSIAVDEGDEVKAGQPLAVVEAMKMENILRAERDATVRKIHVAAGDSLAVDQVIMEFE